MTRALSVSGPAMCPLRIGCQIQACPETPKPPKLALVPACKICGESFELAPNPKGGRPATRCPKHRHSGSIANPAAHNKRKLAARAVKVAQSRAPTTDLEYRQAMAIAWPLSCHDDPRVAAQAGGVSLTGPELDACIANARAWFPDLCRGDKAALGRVLLLSVGRYVAHGLDPKVIAAVPGSMVGGLIKAQQQVAQALNPVGSSWAQLEVVIHAPKESK